MNVFDLFARLTLDTSEYERGLANARGYAQTGGSGITKTLKRVGQTIGTVFATKKIADFGKSLVDASSSFESAFTGVKKTVDETATTSYAMLADAIKLMSTETASSKETIAGVMEAAGQLGISADDIVGFTKTMIELGDSTNLSAEEAAVALARFTNITGESSANVDRLGAAIVDLGNNFATDEASIVDMSTRLAAAGTIAGLSSTDILALSTAMSSVGINAEAGGTAMSTVLTKIGNAVAKGVDPSNEKLNTFAKVAGMSAEEFAAAWKSSPVDALSSFIVGLNGITESGENVNDFLSDLGISGIRETNMVKSLALASDVLTNAVKTSNDAYKENVALTNEAEKRYNTTESRVAQLKEAYSNLKIVIGDELVPTFRIFIAFATEKLTEFTEYLQNGGLKRALESVKSGFERIKEAVSPLTNLLQSFISNENLVADATGALNGAFDLFVEALRIGSEALALVIEKGLAFIEWLNGGSAGAEAMKAAIVGLIAGFVAFDAVNAIINTVKTAFAALNAIMAANPIALVVAAIAALVAAFVYLWNTSEEFRNFWIGLWEVIKSLPEKAAEFIGKALTALKNTVTQVADNIKKAWTGLVDSASKLGENIKKAWSNAKQWGVDLIAKIKSGISEKITEITDKIRGIKDSLTTIFQNLGESALQWGRDLIGNFVSGLQEKLNTLKEKAVGIAQQIKNVIGFSEPKEGPLSNFHTYAPDMMELFAKGIRDNEHLITDAVSSGFDIRDQIGASFNGGRVVSSGAPRGISGSNGNTTVILQVDRTELGRVVFQLNDEETQRVGVRLATGGAYA